MRLNVGAERPRPTGRAVGGRVSPKEDSVNREWGDRAFIAPIVL